jgi:hypothetical protein
MKVRRLIFIASSLVAAAIVVSVVLVFHWNHSQRVFKHLPNLVIAAQSYSRDHVSRGQPMPSSVSIRDLVGSGYISAEEVRDFDGMDVTIYPMTSEAYPQSILIRVRMSDGVQIVAMADGSIQQLPK